jgi:hypothetical protein
MTANVKGSNHFETVRQTWWPRLWDDDTRAWSINKLMTVKRNWTVSNTHLIWITLRLNQGLYGEIQYIISSGNDFLLCSEGLSRQSCQPSWNLSVFFTPSGEPMQIILTLVAEADLSFHTANTKAVFRHGPEPVPATFHSHNVLHRHSCSQSF